MTPGGAPAAALALAVALVLWSPPGSVRGERVRRLRASAAPGAGPAPAAADPPHPRPGAPDPPGTGGRGTGSRWGRGGVPPGPARRRTGAALAGAAVFAVLGGGTGAAVAGIAAAVAAERWLRRSGGPPPADGLADLPVACDLIAVCLAAGTPIGPAVAAVATSVPGPLGAELAQVGALYRLGAAPRQSWAAVPPALAPLARVMVRAGESGSSAVPALQRLAGDLRTAERSAVEAAVRRAGVWVLAPLGVCFLPAFLCLGVVPMVLGIAADVFG